MNRIWHFILKRSEKTTSNTHENFWASIDEMPLYNWIKCMNDELDFVNKRPKHHPRNAKRFEALYDQYLERYGLGDKLERYLKLLQERALLQCDRVVSGDKFLENDINVLSNRIEQMEMHFGNGQKIETTLIYLGKWLGYPIKAKETTVVEYYDLIEEYGKWANKTKRDSGK